MNNTAVETSPMTETAEPRLWPRAVECIAALFLLAVLGIPMLIVAVAVRLTSRGPILYWSDRIGVLNTIFALPKFRTMRVDAPVVATHLLSDPTRHITPIGSFLRKSSLDELPQLFSILRGHITFVGPRPALFNQNDLIAQRTALGVHRLTPGMTGWAQINGRDMISIPEKVALDAEYMRRRSRLFDLRIMMLTALRVFGRDGIQH
jgi:O-antigen biosynthesis protein WbqP